MLWINDDFVDIWAFLSQTRTTLLTQKNLKCLFSQELGIVRVLLRKSLSCEVSKNPLRIYARQLSGSSFRNSFGLNGAWPAPLLGSIKLNFLDGGALPASRPESAELGAARLPSATGDSNARACNTLPFIR